DIAYNAMWSEGSFYAADAAINVGLDQVTPTNTTLTPTALAPAPPALDSFTATGTIGFPGPTRLPGYSMGAGTGYNPGGFAFYTYSVVARAVARTLGSRRAKPRARSTSRPPTARSPSEDCHEETDRARPDRHAPPAAPPGGVRRRQRHLRTQCPAQRPDHPGQLGQYGRHGTIGRIQPRDHVPSHQS